LGFVYTDTLILDGTLGITKLKVNVFNANNTPTSTKKNAFTSTQSGKVHQGITVHNVDIYNMIKSFIIGSRDIVGIQIIDRIHNH